MAVDEDNESLTTGIFVLCLYVGGTEPHPMAQLARLVRRWGSRITAGSSR
jgi:hypothetical protein